MPIFLESAVLPLTLSEINKLWMAVCTACQYEDKNVTVANLSESEIRTLNRDYRHKDRPTNVLTFSYGEMAHSEQIQGAPKDVQVSDHDIMICADVAKKEAISLNVTYRDYTALLLVHAFLHATGLDHERSAEVEQETRRLEEEILSKTGFSAIHLSA